MIHSLTHHTSFDSNSSISQLINRLINSQLNANIRQFNNYPEDHDGASAKQLQLPSIVSLFHPSFPPPPPSSLNFYLQQFHLFVFLYFIFRDSLTNFFLFISLHFLKSLQLFNFRNVRNATYDPKQANAN